MIDTHAHLDALDDDPRRARRARATRASTRILTVGTDVAGCRRALELADEHEGSTPFSASTRTATGATDDDLAELRELLAHPKAVAVGEMGLDWFRDYAPRDEQLRLFARSSSSRPRSASRS